MFHENVSESLGEHRITITVPFRILRNSLLNGMSTASLSYNVQVSLAIHGGYVPDKISNHEYQNQYFRHKLG